VRLNCSFIGFRRLASLALDVVVPWTGYKTSLAFVGEGAFRKNNRWRSGLSIYLLNNLNLLAQPVKGPGIFLVIEY
jgi:hypothetical protein